MGIFVNNSTDLRGSVMTGGMSQTGEVGSAIVSGSGHFAPDFRTGQSFSGQVVSQDGNTITLKLSNEQLIQARLSGNVNVLVGQLLSFEVQSTNNNTISLRPLYSNLANNSTLTAALKAAGLPLTESNLAMTKEMMSQGMPINKEALADMTKTVNSFPNANPTSIVQMTKMGLAINELNITQYENYRNFEHRIINDVTDAANSLTDELVSLSAAGEEETLSFAADVLNMLDTQVLKDESVILPKDMPPVIDAEGAVLQALEEVMPQPEGVTDAIIDMVMTDDDNVQTSDKILQFSTELNELAEAVGRELPDSMNTADTIEFLKNVLTESAFKGNLSQENVKEAFSKLLANNDFKEFLSDSIKSQWMLTPDRIDKAGEIEQLYSRILKQTQRIIDMAQSSNTGMTNAAQAAQHMSDNVTFMNQLNEFVNYVQLPLKMYQENAHGELYVYSNKKKLAEKDGNLTALLHLDMEHLGPMDVYVSMNNYEKVNTHFYLSSEEMIDFIAEHIHLLEERLADKGYNISTGISKREGNGFGDGKPITDEFFKADPNEEKSTISMFQFDVRA